MAASLRYSPHKLEESQIVGSFTPQKKRTMDNLDVVLYRLEFFEIPLEGFEVLQQCGLSVWSGHRGHEFTRKVRQLVGK